MKSLDELRKVEHSTGQMFSMNQCCDKKRACFGFSSRLRDSDT